MTVNDSQCQRGMTVSPWARHEGHEGQAAVAGPGQSRATGADVAGGHACARWSSHRWWGNFHAPLHILYGESARQFMQGGAQKINDITADGEGGGFECGERAGCA